MNIIYDYNAFSLQKFGGITRYYTELNKIFNKNENIKSKIIAPIHQNYYLKNNKYNERFNIYLNRYPKYTKTFVENYNFYISNILINFIKPKILHQTYYSEKTYKFNKTKTKSILTVYDLIHEIFYKDFGFEKNYRPKLTSLSQADHIICISNKTKNDLINIYNIPEDKIEVIYLGCSRFDVKKNYEKNIFDFPYILFVGSRRRYKNFYNLLKAYSTSLKLKKDIKIICFGGEKFGVDEKKLLQTFGISENQIIQINGNDETLTVLYKNAEAFIFPSIYEGFGLPILESMKNNCPVILSSIETFREVAGDSALYFDPMSTESIREKIEEVIYSDTKKLILKKNGTERVKKFTWEKCAEETLKIYQKVI